MSTPILKEVQHRYSIETDSQEYPCDDYIIYIGRGVQAILITPDYTDCFFITGAVTAIHDFASGQDLESFAAIRENAIKMAEAAVRPADAYQDVGTA